ncbi:MAG: DUF2490 domain-containing protein [Prolixibacteraceae bacterium]
MRVFIFFVAVLLISPVLAQAQNVKVIRDLRSRTSIGAEKEIFNNLELFGNVEFGLEQDLEKIGKIHGEIGTNYSPFKFLAIEASYRYTKNRKNYKDEYKYNHTYAIAMEADYKFDRFKTSYRIQYQNVDDEANWFASSDKTNNLVRNRVKLKYNIKGFKIEPYISTELYTPWDFAGLYASKLKTYIGCEYKVKEVGVLKVYYRNDKELTQFLPYSYHTLGIDFTFKF